MSTFERLDILTSNVDLLAVFTQNYWSLLVTLAAGVGLGHLFLSFTLEHGFPRVSAASSCRLSKPS